MDMSVVAATQRDLDRLSPEVAGSALAAIALVLAAELDSAENDLEAKLAVVRTLEGVFAKLSRPVPGPGGLIVDQLTALDASRRTRLEGRSAT